MKTISISGQPIITDWRNARVLLHENTEKKVRVNKEAEQELKKQKPINSLSSNSI